MGVYIDFKLKAECSEEDLLRKLHGIRTRIESLPVQKVSPVTLVDPVFSQVVITGARFNNGVELPAIVQERLDSCDDGLGSLRVSMSMILASGLPGDLLTRFAGPAMKFATSTDLWKLEDYPEIMKVPFFLTFHREALVLEFTNLLSCYGYALMVDIDSGCETLILPFTTYRMLEDPLWLGAGFIKTQYSKDFKKAHETGCRVLDLFEEEGLLLSASDTCGYYKSRDWREAMKAVNQEMDFAWTVGQMFSPLPPEAREQGVEEVVNNAATLRPPWEADVSDYKDEDTDADDKGDDEESGRLR